MIEQNSKGQWEVHYEGQWAKFPTEEEAKARLKTWKGEEPKSRVEEILEDDYEDDGQPDEAQEWHDFDPDA